MNNYNRRIAHTLMLAAGIAALAGCGSKSDDGPKNVEQVKQEAAKLDTPDPGQYRQTMQITQFDVPGMPKEAAAQMKAMMTKTQENTFCLTKADAEKGFRDMFKDVGKDQQCTYSKFDVDGGKLDAQMDCQSKTQGKATMKLNGTVTSSGSDVTVAMDMTGQPAPVQSMKMTMHVASQRVGDCKPT